MILNQFHNRKKENNEDYKPSLLRAVSSFGWYMWFEKEELRVQYHNRLKIWKKKLAETRTGLETKTKRPHKERQ